jgi:hypothetical protein
MSEEREENVQTVTYLSWLFLSELATTFWCPEPKEEKSNLPFDKYLWSAVHNTVQRQHAGKYGQCTQAALFPGRRKAKVAR